MSLKNNVGNNRIQSIGKILCVQTIVKKINKIHIIILLSVFFYVVNVNANIRPIACSGSVIGGKRFGNALCQYNNIILQTTLYCGWQGDTMTLSWDSHSIASFKFRSSGFRDEKCIIIYLPNISRFSTVRITISACRLNKLREPTYILLLLLCTCVENILRSCMGVSLNATNRGNGNIYCYPYTYITTHLL